MSEYQFTAFEIGQVRAHLYHGLCATDIARIIRKPDGRSHWSPTAVQNQIDKLNAAPRWRGERKEGSGAPRKSTEKQDRQMVSLLERNKGKEKVTIGWLRKRLLWTRRLGNTALEERLFDAGLQYLRRRQKSLVPTAYLRPRVAYCEAVKRKHQDTLNQWAYSDGTVFYLDRSAAENESTQRAALGSFVWRRSDRRDALFADCVGPSSYNKAQGRPVRIWGLLAMGQLNVYILEEGEVMNTFLYVELIEDYFPEWLGGCSSLVQDFERCLHSEESLAALEDIGVELVEGYPPCSQDFNAIENVWKLLRDRLAQTLPIGLEDRPCFIRRLKAAVRWLNTNRSEDMWHLSTNQKERVNAALANKPKGARTKF